MPTTDLSFFADPEQHEFNYGDKTYKVDFGTLGAAVHERIVVWAQNLVATDEEQAQRRSAELFAEAYGVDAAEAISVAPLARKTMLLFLVSGRLPNRATAP